LKRIIALFGALLFALCAFAAAQVEAPRPALEMQRTVSGEYVARGESASLIYRVENTGNVPLEDVSVTDPLCGKVLSVGELAPGEYRTALISMTVTKPCSSAPQAVWYYGGMRYERTLVPLSVAPAENKMSVGLEADRSGAIEGETALFTAKVQNEGNTELYDVRLSDAQLGHVGTIEGVIRPGESAQHVFRVRIGQSGVFRITAKARTQSDEEVSAQSEEVRIVLAGDPNGAQLRILAKPSAEDAQKGRAKVQITLHNDGASPIDNVSISERSLGLMRTLVCVAPGQTQLTLECEIDQEREMLFLAQFPADDGGRTTVLAEKTALRPGTAEPDGFLQGDSVQLGISAYAVFMYGALGLIGVLAAVLLLRVAGKRRRRRIARERRARRMRILRKNARMNEAEWVQTRPHKPVSLKDENDN